MGFLDLIGKITSSVEGALSSVTPKKFRLSPDFVSALTSNITTFLAGGQTEYSSWSIPFPRKLSQTKFLEELKSRLEQEGVKLASGDGFIQTEKGKLSFVGAKLNLEKVEMKVPEKKPEVAFVRLNENEAKKFLRESFEKYSEPPPRRSREEKAYEKNFAIFQKKYVRHVMAASDGLKAGIRVLGGNPESNAWENKISIFIIGYCDNLMKYDRKDLLSGSKLEFPLKSSTSATKFKQAFEQEVKSALGAPYPIQIAIEMGGSFRAPLLIVAAKAPKVQKVKDLETEKAVRSTPI